MQEEVNICVILYYKAVYRQINLEGQWVLNKNGRKCGNSEK